MTPPNNIPLSLPLLLPPIFSHALNPSLSSLSPPPRFIVSCFLPFFLFFLSFFSCFSFLFFLFLSPFLNLFFFFPVSFSDGSYLQYPDRCVCVGGGGGGSGADPTGGKEGGKRGDPIRENLAAKQPVGE